MAPTKENHELPSRVVSRATSKLEDINGRVSHPEPHARMAPRRFGPADGYHAAKSNTIRYVGSASI